jgi:prevent-host-death family protein
MSVYSVAQAKAHLSTIIEAVRAGEVVEITKRGKPVARILRAHQQASTIDWGKIDAFRARLRKSKASVPVLRKTERY